MTAANTKLANCVEILPHSRFTIEEEVAFCRYHK
jgi:hypothetical protein